MYYVKLNNITRERLEYDLYRDSNLYWQKEFFSTKNYKIITLWKKCSMFFPNTMLDFK